MRQRLEPFQAKVALGACVAVLAIVLFGHHLTWSKLLVVEWDALAAVFTALAIFAALRIATSEAKERKSRADDATSTFCRMVLPEVIYTRGEFRKLRDFFRDYSGKVSGDLMSKALPQFEEKVALRLDLSVIDSMRESLLFLRASEAMAISNLHACVRHFRRGVAYLATVSNRSESWGTTSFEALRAHSLVGQLAANDAYRAIWKHSEPTNSPPNEPEFELDEEEKQFLLRYHAKAVRDPDPG
jgi:hypothetical protein